MIDTIEESDTNSEATMWEETQEVKKMCLGCACASFRGVYKNRALDSRNDLSLCVLAWGNTAPPKKIGSFEVINRTTAMTGTYKHHFFSLENFLRALFASHSPVSFLNEVNPPNSDNRGLRGPIIGYNSVGRFREESRQTSKTWNDASLSGRRLAIDDVPGGLRSTLDLDDFAIELCD